MSALQPLLRTPLPKRGESYRGYILRLSEENICKDPAKLFVYAGMSRGDTRKPEQPVELLAALTGKSIEVYKDVDYKSLTGPHWVRSISGHDIAYSSLSLKRPKICVECIQELGYIPSRWDLEMVNVCHVHKRMLSRYCISCEQKLHWFRPGLLKCRCGKKIVDVGEPVESLELLDLMTLISNIIDRKTLHDRDSKTGMPFTGLSKLTLGFMMSLVSEFGDKTHKIDGSKSTFGLEGNDSGLGITKKAGYVLSDWPNNLYKLFKENPRLSELDPRQFPNSGNCMNRIIHKLLTH